MQKELLTFFLPPTSLNIFILNITSKFAKKDFDCFKRPQNVSIFKDVKITQDIGSYYDVNSKNSMKDKSRSARVLKSDELVSIFKWRLLKGVLFTMDLMLTLYRLSRLQMAFMFPNKHPLDRHTPNRYSLVLFVQNIAEPLSTSFAKSENNFSHLKTTLNRASNTINTINVEQNDILKASTNECQATCYESKIAYTMNKHFQTLHPPSARPPISSLHLLFQTSLLMFVLFFVCTLQQINILRTDFQNRFKLLHSSNHQQNHHLHSYYSFSYPSSQPCPQKQKINDNPYSKTQQQLSQQQHQQLENTSQQKQSQQHNILHPHNAEDFLFEACLFKKPADFLHSDSVKNCLQNSSNKKKIINGKMRSQDNMFLQVFENEAINDLAEWMELKATVNSSMKIDI